MGLRNGVDISRYADPFLEPGKMFEIYSGLLEDLPTFDDIEWEAYDSDQQQWIRAGLIDGLDVSSYIDPSLSSDEMGLVYAGLVEGKQASLDDYVAFEGRDIL